MTLMSKPHFSEQYACPTCKSHDTVALAIEFDGNESHAVVWCAIGHISYIDHVNEDRLLHTIGQTMTGSS